MKSLSFYMKQTRQGGAKQKQRKQHLGHVNGVSNGQRTEGDQKTTSHKTKTRGISIRKGDEWLFELVDEVVKTERKSFSNYVTLLIEQDVEKRKLKQQRKAG